MASNTVNLYELFSAAHLQAVFELQQTAWAMPADDAIPTHTLRALQHAGGALIGRFDGTRLVGFVLGFPTDQPGLLWSDMMGVHPDYRGQGIALELKSEQRRWALRRGYTRIGWTFDPLRRRNAHLNLRKLATVAPVTTNVYHEDFYGTMPGINAGLPSDRLEVAWHVDREPVAPPDVTPVMLFGDAREDPLPFIPEVAAYAAPIPYDLDTLRTTDIKQLTAWQTALRLSLIGAFRQGYHAVDFHTNHAAQRCWYVLTLRDETP